MTKKSEKVEKVVEKVEKAAEKKTRAPALPLADLLDAYMKVHKSGGTYNELLACFPDRKEASVQQRLVTLRSRFRTEHKRELPQLQRRNVSGVGRKKEDLASLVEKYDAELSKVE